MFDADSLLIDMEPSVPLMSDGGLSGLKASIVATVLKDELGNYVYASFDGGYGEDALLVC